MDWQPIETAPKDQYILLWVPWVSRVLMGGYSTGSRIFGHKTGWKIVFPGMPSAYVAGVPTHWQPLPAPPQ